MGERPVFGTPDLGRGGSRLVFTDDYVRKFVSGTWEPTYLQEFPGVFIPVVQVRVDTETTNPDGPNTNFDMPRGIGAAPDVLGIALLSAAPRLAQLWNRPWDGQDPDWRLRLQAHLYRIGTRFDLSLIRIKRLTEVLVTPVEPCLIHGDPTLANCVFLEGRWLWIDPLTRSYIPGDAHVDLGKMFQSCLGYEEVLLGGVDPKPNHVVMERLAAELKLNVMRGLHWAAVHWIRLLPYQREEDLPDLLKVYRWLEGLV